MAIHALLGSLFSQFFTIRSLISLRSVPSLLKSTDDWGAFIFFAAWCFISFAYVFFVVPEVAGLSVEEIEEVFKGSWFNAYKRSKAAIWQGVEAQERSNQVDDKEGTL